MLYAQSNNISVDGLVPNDRGTDINTNPLHINQVKIDLILTLCGLVIRFIKKSDQTEWMLYQKKYIYTEWMLNR